MKKLKYIAIIAVIVFGAHGSAHAQAILSPSTQTESSGVFTIVHTAADGCCDLHLYADDGSEISYPFPGFSTLDDTTWQLDVSSYGTIGDHLHLLGGSYPDDCTDRSSYTSCKETFVGTYSDIEMIYGEPSPPPAGGYVKPSGVVWAMSALSIFTLIEFVYFLIFFVIIYVMAWGIMQVFKPIMKIITYGD